MSIKTIHDIHKDYVHSGVSLVREAQGFENKELLQELLTELSQEYVKTVFGTVEKVKISAEDGAERDLISSEQLKQKFFQNIAKETNIDVKVKNARQLVEALFSENLEVPKERDEDILKPRILGTVENIGTIILPPDILEIVIGSGKGREYRERPVGFDKIGMVEERLSTKLGRERTTFHWKTGILNDNQMRKVSYYHLYLPEFDKTLLLNNQYGEGVFVVQGNFNIRDARKSDLKGSSEAVMIKFDYEHPEEFLERLGIELNKRTYSNETVEESKQPKESLNNSVITCKDIKEALKDKKAERYALGNAGRQKYKLNIAGQEVSYLQICRYFGFQESQNDLFKDEMFDRLSKATYGEGYYEYWKENIKKTLESSTERKRWYNMGAELRQIYKLNMSGKGIGYVQICRYFGFQESGKNLYKDEIFDKLSKEIYREGYYEYRKRIKGISWDEVKTNIKKTLESSTERKRWYNMGNELRKIYKLNIAGQEVSYVQICRYFLFQESRNNLYKDEIFDKLSKEIYGEGYYEYWKANIKEALKDKKAERYALGNALRQKYKLNIGGQEMSYIQICRYFGFDEYPDDLYKDEIFDKLSKEIYGEGYYEYLKRTKGVNLTLTGDEIKANIKKTLESSTERKRWYNMGNELRQGYKLNIAGQEISYLQICRYFGFQESINTLYKDEIFDKLSKEIYGEGYYEYWKENIKKTLESSTEKNIWSNLGGRGRQIYKLNIAGQEISYVQICRYFGFQESRDVLCKDGIFKKVTQMIFGD